MKMNIPLDKQAKTSFVTQELLRELFAYDDGKLVWRKHPTMHGKIAGTVTKKGYRQIAIRQTAFRASRLVFLYHHGYMPKIVDHINGDPTNDKIENLRAADEYSNRHNMRLTSRNKSGVKGVFWDNTAKSWCATVHANGRFVVRKWLQDLELAELVVIMGREKYHGDFANHGSHKCN